MTQTVIFVDERKPSTKNHEDDKNIQTYSSIKPKPKLKLNSRLKHWLFHDLLSCSYLQHCV